MGHLELGVDLDALKVHVIVLDRLKLTLLVIVTTFTLLFTLLVLALMAISLLKGILRENFLQSLDRIALAWLSRFNSSFDRLSGGSSRLSFSEPIRKLLIKIKHSALADVCLA